MSSRSFEITILSAENLRTNKTSIKKNVFVKIQTDGNGEVRTTKVNGEGGSYPSWNEKVVMEVPLHARFITLEVNCKATMGIKSVGIAMIPVSDIVGGFVPQNQVQFLSYRLWDSKVNRNGVINISVRVKMPEISSLLPPAINGLPAQGVPVTGKSSNAVVTGIPINWF
ncbi:hypothetical protein HN51_046690 [Arachis hypogaea]|uniref:C2 domain-containing protein n=1 Tax=Arachis hypogaea TaxID=3818 RepID=A0A445EH69_ARAHY|nr:BON1-associated protein 2 [Arachis ipaensis]XP_025632108.1 BON1-associated protein 2 [Arachis hypogaea]XP_025641399.1 BON1-associated protein 2 [Arachis hypogaea]XP_057742146.1 BON1-associated protein 2-like [Arachis stenosperma]QHO22887.1 BON1-associated protein [Arachis hypogaea]QHO52415.1 BON1-associated protein [Arachis hypogaea]RYR24546.1 hypothetical protein Ahy_B02g058047 [Arachis hypogaea]RYR74692.1 hypothetical protein Ahy_A02g009411 [Arachis hypogaea]